MFISDFLGSSEPFLNSLWDWARSQESNSLSIIYIR